MADGLEFSFSGLKTAVTTYVRREPAYDPADVAASFAAAVMDVLIAKIQRALSLGTYRSVAVVGGVEVNTGASFTLMTVSVKV